MACNKFHVKQQRPGDDCTTASRRPRIAAVLGAAILAVGSLPAGIAAQTPPAPPEAAAPAPDKTAFSETATYTVRSGEALREFSYTWPAKVAAVPQLTTRFTAERDRLLAEQRADWDEALREFAEGDCLGCVNRSFEKSWEVVADLPRFLSLSASFYAYTGGAHGNGAFDALVCDREAQQAIDPKAMFRSPEALEAALGPAWCKALKAEKIKRFEGAYSEDGIFPCPAIADLTVLVGSASRRSFDRIGLIAAPYVAGAYAEGVYEVTLPVTPAVLAAVRPEYAAAFAPGK